MGNRAGQGYGVPKPKRARCPDCGKKGVTQWKVTPYGEVRGCQFCGGSWTPASWSIARAPGVSRLDDQTKRLSGTDARGGRG